MKSANRVLVRLLGALLLSGCACERSIDITGDEDTDAATIVDGGGDPLSTDTVGTDAVPVDVTTTDASWDPPMDNLGESGWRESTEPWCREDSGHGGTIDLWSDERGVFIVLPDEESMVGTFILENEGHGWEALTGVIGGTMDMTSSIEHLTGLPGGVLFGYSSFGQLATIDPADGSVSRRDLQLMDLHVVSEDLAYGIISSDPQLVKYESGSWGPYPGDVLPYDTVRVWGDGERVFTGGENGIILESVDGHWVVHDTGTLSAIISFWGFSSDDVWAGTSQGMLLHDQGDGWSRVEWPEPGDDTDDCRRTGESIEGMWGADGLLFLHTWNALLMYDGVEFTVLGYWPGTQTEVDGINYCAGRLAIHSIWGNSTDEVFLAVEESEITENLCSEYVLWWDGSSFHWF